MNLKRSKKDYTKIKLMIFIVFVILVLLIALFSKYIVPFDPYKQDLSHALATPDHIHLLGTDRYGRDMLSRVIMGGQTTIFSSLLLVIIVTVTGSVIGIFCGYYGGKIDTVLMRISDVFLAFPGMVFAIAVAGVLSGGLVNAIIALACISWPKYARVARSQTMTVKNMPYISAVQLAGCSSFQIMFKHILPNIISTILVTAILDIGTMIMELAGLSFLGLGATPPIAEWGSMMADGRSMLQLSPWVIMAPGAAIFITVMLFNLLGDTLRDYLDPRK